MIRNFLYKSLLLAALILPLTACGGGEPSESTIKTLIVEQTMKEYNALPNAIKNSVPKPNPEAATIEKLACKESKESSGYNCDIKMTMKNNGAERSQTTTLRLVKADSGWQIITH